MRVFAYLDPGSGSMLLQMLLGGIAGVAVSIKMFGKRIFSVLAFWKRDEEKAAEASAGAGAPQAKTEPEKDAVKESV